MWYNYSVNRREEEPNVTKVLQIFMQGLHKNATVGFGHQIRHCPIRSPDWTLSKMEQVIASRARRAILAPRGYYYALTSWKKLERMNEMKKLHLYAIAAIAIILLVYATCSVTVNHLYPRTGIITKIDYENNIITITDYAGHRWEWTGIEDWQEGDIAAMIMNDMASETIFDDQIVKVYYNGWVE